MNFINLILILFFAKFATSFDLDPISGKVEVVEHFSYDIGVDDYGELDLKWCSFVSDTDCNATFTIGPTRSGPPSEYLCYSGAYLYTNIVTSRGVDGDCKIKVSNVDENGPKIWNLTGFDAYTNEFITATFYITFFYLATTLNNGVRVMEGENLFDHLNLENKNLVSCTLTYKGSIEIDLDLKSEKASITHISPNNKTNRDDAMRFTSLGQNYCGYKLTNVSRDFDNNVYRNLTAVDNQGLRYRANPVIRTDPRNLPGNLHMKRWIVLGNELTISCGISNTFCLIFNPDGLLVSEQCIYKSKVATKNHLGKWKCHIAGWNSMVGWEYIIELFKKERGVIDTWQIETTEYLSIGCQLANETARFLYCKMIAPNGHVINVLDFVASDRFSAFGTNLRDRTCSLQIKKPLLNSEIGLWKCEFKQEYKVPTGTFLHVNSMAIPDYPKQINLIAEIGKELIVTCQVPYYSEYCLIKSPNGTTYNIRKLTDLNMGRCQYYIEKVDENHNGTWTCTYGRKTGLPDEEIKVEVSIATLLRYSRRVEADSGDVVTLTCSSGGIPLQYCRFISPNGSGYHLGNHQKLERIAYYGKGIEYGECGISISNILPSEAGEWKCVTKLFNEIDEEHHEKEIIGEIFVDLIVPRQFTGMAYNYGAIGIGTAAMIIVIGSVIAMVAITKWKQKQNVGNNINTEINENQAILNN